MEANKSGLSEALSPRRIKRKEEGQEVQPPRNYLRELLELLLPPFLLSALGFLFRILATIVRFLVDCFRTADRLGQASQEFHKRRFEEEVEDLEVEQEQLGFTNQVLVQEGRKSVNFFLPVYVTCKIKSIKDVSVQALTGNISCALIVNVKYGDLPEEIVSKLENSIIMQLNCGQAMLLTHDGISISLKRNQKERFLIFTIRKLFLSFLIEDTLWSPFELIELVISLTLNTVTIPPDSLQPLNEPTGYHPKKEYKVSFNCMRNSDLIPISFALDCVYGVYDLAERKLETYHSKFGTLKEIQKNYQEICLKKKKNGKKADNKEGKKGDKKGEKSPEKKEGKSPERRDKKVGFDFVVENEKKVMTQINLNPPPASQGGNGRTNQLLMGVAEVAARRLSMRVGATDTRSPPKKVKYFQYTHLVIPLYKYPGNSLITIFLPVLLLAMLSLAIFFQEPQLSGRIGSIATMFLGYIALIPSIKEQLPPSSKLTVIETLVYIQTLCCMLCLYESFMIRDFVDYKFQWEQNYTFLSCLAIHVGVFLFVLGLYLVHKLRWEPNYNYNQKIAEVKPIDNHISWDNPYCDHVFLKFNQDILNSDSRNKDQRLIKPYVNPTTLSTANIEPSPSQGEKKQGKDEEAVSLSMFEDAHPAGSRKERIRKEMGLEDMWLKVPTSPRSMGEFVFPDEKLYYDKKAD